MKMKLIVFAVCLVMVCSCLALAACNKPDTTTPVQKDFIWPEDGVVYLHLGDSIGEALAGPSPLTEREYYGYYGINGICNDFTFVNRAVSGWKSFQLLDYIKRGKDEGPDINYTFIRRADVIQVSVLGNDLLQTDFSVMMQQCASGTTDAEKFAYADKILRGEGYVDGDDVNHGNSYDNLTAIVKQLYKINPGAQILLQTVYNPVFDTSSLLAEGEYNSDGNNSLGAAEYNRIELKTDYGVTPNEYREMGAKLISRMNQVILDVARDYNLTHGKQIFVVDVYQYYEDYIATDTTENQIYARRLFSQDYVHPSNEGHAMIADATQNMLNDLGIGIDKATYLANYKKLRIDQLNRLYAYEGTEVDVVAVTTAINAAIDNAGVTKAYFDGITAEGYEAEVDAYFDSVMNDRHTQYVEIDCVKSFYAWAVPNYAQNV